MHTGQCWFSWIPRYNPSNLSMIEQQIYENFKITGIRRPLPRSIIPMNMCCFWRTAKRRIMAVYLLAGRYGNVLKVGIGKSAKLTRQHSSYESAKIAIQSLGEQREVAVFDELGPGDSSGQCPRWHQRLLKRALRTLDEKDKAILKPTCLWQSWKKPVIFSLSTETHFSISWKRSGIPPDMIHELYVEPPFYIWHFPLEKYVWSLCDPPEALSSFKLKTSLQNLKSYHLIFIKTKRISWHEHANKTFWMTDYFEIHQS